MKRTNIFLMERHIKELRAISKKTGSTSAELVRRAIDEFLEKRKKKEQ